MRASLPFYLCFLALLSWGAALAFTAGAQEPISSEPAALTRMREKFQDAAAAEIQSLNTLFDPHLATLETAAGGAGDYALALSIKRRREQLRSTTQTSGAVGTATQGKTLPVFDGKAELNAVLARHAERMKAVSEPLITEYLNQLKPFLTSGSTAKLASAETRKANALLTNPTAPRSNKIVGWLDHSFTTMTNVHYVADPANTGDRFKVEHDGQTLWVRLQWAVCPPVDAKNRNKLQLLRERFGIDELAVIALGQTAREFTELYLVNHDLTLVAKDIPATDDTVTALVYVEPIGLFQHVLLDYGLAIVDAPKANDKHKAMETGIINSLIEREKRAKNSPDGEGGWQHGP